MVLSKLFYCSSVWANTSDSNIKKLQLVQKFAVRIITGARKFDHITPHAVTWIEMASCKRPIAIQRLINDV